MTYKPFKMKVPTLLKMTSALKKTSSDERSLPRKAWDKLTQIGMGVKEAALAADVPVGASPRFPGARSLEAFKVGYQREKKHDEEIAARKASKRRVEEHMKSTHKKTKKTKKLKG